MSEFPPISLLFQILNEIRSLIYVRDDEIQAGRVMAGIIAVSPLAAVRGFEVFCSTSGGIRINTGLCISCRRKLCGFLPRDGRRDGYEVFALARGDRLDTCRDGCMRFWIVIRGTAAVCTTFEDGRRQITGLEMPGDTICGLMTTPDAPSWLEALEPAAICQLDFSATAADLRSNPDFMMELFRLIHRRLEVTSSHLSTLGRLDSTERVMLFLAQMVLRVNRKAGEPVRLPMSREDIADYLGLNTETVSRIFSKIKKSGLVRFLAPTEYVIPDMAAIARRLPVPIEPAGQSDFPLPLSANGTAQEIGA